VAAITRAGRGTSAPSRAPVSYMNLSFAAPLALILLAAPLAEASPDSPFDADFESLDVDAEEVPHDLSLTFSPLHLLVPFLELTLEYRLADKFGIAAIAGGGARSSVVVGGIGARFNYYLFGDFGHGMQLGIETMFAGGGTTDGPSALAGGLTFGSYLGYKFVADVGFTLDLGAGAEYRLILAESAGKSVEVNQVGLLLNLNAGWSFDL